MDKKQNLELDLAQLQSELKYLISLYGYKISQANQLDEEMKELDLRKASIKRQIFDVEVELTDMEGC